MNVASCAHAHVGFPHRREVADKPPWTMERVAARSARIKARLVLRIYQCVRYLSADRLSSETFARLDSMLSGEK